LLDLNLDLNLSRGVEAGGKVEAEVEGHRLEAEGSWRRDRGDH
jgi:hypothetical protein